ncbi:hypothetical protein PHYBLDRAFT_65409 [Phycomyces blakesleeanus NRRL 1555(-)]|uniref:Uncharacterized protein n=1 Tax=Phycomyces blakesleeanus (strain ATCC 8743b / DSM 1359 / FGSC 10004 / NBRC 33097 / NRRL 1555) TaxID=763407 RepID=A0A163ACH0_PHYB8|nr:hypothetical protein PHYBLDRAFT_65409 [Phycomyces blakesleeanus NRRL 1555(-)]OAD72551.1 hypothetical protein PHYBLDRAFT_65409 [Phycomyces blakesleeanus NRRL 1555(-)]|eukprot:XP_018290591.1 hypothetical protein PHYBLDRAFT_65409 [Phycomyces blakesleeanus NRRL 1555(-)]
MALKLNSSDKRCLLKYAIRIMVQLPSTDSTICTNLKDKRKKVGKFYWVTLWTGCLKALIIVPDDQLHVKDIALVSSLELLFYNKYFMTFGADSILLSLLYFGGLLLYNNDISRFNINYNCYVGSESI